MLSQIQLKLLAFFLGEDQLKFSEAHLTVLGDIMNTDHLLDLIDSNLTITEPFKCVHEILLTDIARIINIEPSEKSE